jgi:hypothetical protein
MIPRILLLLLAVSHPHRMLAADWVPPGWALLPTGLNYSFTAAFLDWTAKASLPSSSTSSVDGGGGRGDGAAQDEGNGKCHLHFNNYGDNCGMCRGDCKTLSRALQSRGALRTLADDPDVIIVSPELAVKPGTTPARSWWVDSRSMDRALPRRPPGKFYLIRKYRAGMAFRCADVDGHGVGAPSRLLTQPKPASRPASSRSAAPEKKALNCSNAFVKSERGREASCDAFCRLLYRPDVIWAAFDMADHDVKDDALASRILSVTLPAGTAAYKGDAWARFREGHRQSPRGDNAELNNNNNNNNEAGSQQQQQQQQQLLAWFRGNCHGGELRTSSARFDLARAFSAGAGGTPKPGLVQLDWYFEAKDNSCPGIEGPRGDVHNDKQAKAAAAKWFASRGDYFGTMLRSSFGFVPHGFARWNLRFLELLSAGTIPVVIADGLRMPFEQLIPWDDVIVKLPEALVKRGDGDEIIAPLLAMSPAEVLQRGRLCRHIFETYFGSADAKAAALLGAIGRIVADGKSAAASVPAHFGECRTSYDRRVKWTSQCASPQLQLKAT